MYTASFSCTPRLFLRFVYSNSVLIPDSFRARYDTSGYRRYSSVFVDIACASTASDTYTRSVTAQRWRSAVAALIYLPPPSCLGMVGSAYPFAAGSTGSSSTQPIVGRLSSRVGHQASRPQHRTSTHPALWSAYVKHAATYFLSLPRTHAPNFHTPRLLTIIVLPHLPREPLPRFAACRCVSD